MRKQDVVIGGVYWVKVSGVVVRVRVENEHYNGGWVGRNLKTGREVRIKTAAKLHRPAPVAEL